MLGDQSIPRCLKGLNSKASIPRKLENRLPRYQVKATAMMPRALEEILEELLQPSKIRTWHHRVHQKVDMDGTQDQSDKSGLAHHRKSVSLPTLKAIMDVLLHGLAFDSS